MMPSFHADLMRGVASYWVEFRQLRAGLSRSGGNVCSAVFQWVLTSGLAN